VRRTTRFSLIGAAALAVGLVGAPSAFGTAADDNYSEAIGAAYPNYQDDDNLGGGTSLFVQLHTRDADGSDFIHQQETEEATVLIDDDFAFTTAKLAQCSNTDPGAPGGADDQSLVGTSTQQALVKCGKAHIGSGAAKFRAPTNLTPPAPPAFQNDVTVTTFNGAPSVTGQTGDPESNFDGGKPTVLLHAKPNIGTGAAAQPPNLVVGELTGDDPALGGGQKYGTMLDVQKTPDIGGSNPGDGALTIFNSMLSKSFKVKKGKKKVTKHLVRATCPDTDVDGAGGEEPNRWDFAVRFEYDDGSEEIDSTHQNCGSK
jgi:hypothetical protein